jgi:hypothetical protein
MNDEVIRRQADVEIFNNVRAGPVSEASFAPPASGAYAPYAGVYAPQSHGSPALASLAYPQPYAAQPYGAQAPARGVYAQRYDDPAVDIPTATPMEAAPPDTVVALQLQSLDLGYRSFSC